MAPAKNGVVVQIGQYAALFVCRNPEDVKAEFESAIHKLQIGRIGGPIRLSQHIRVAPVIADIPHHPIVDSDLFLIITHAVLEHIVQYRRSFPIDGLILLG